MNVLVIGKGPVGRALQDHMASLDEVGPVCNIVGARSPMLAGPRREGTLKDYSLVVHAGGPAGEAACLSDPLGAFQMHYELTTAIAEALTGDPPKTLAIVGTLAPKMGFYTKVKQAALDSVGAIYDRACDGGYAGLSVSVAECGQIIGPGIALGRGVVGEFMANAFTGGPLYVDGSGEQIVLSTDVRMLAEKIVKHAHHLVTHAPISNRVTVHALADLCADVVEQRGYKRPEVIVGAWRRGKVMSHGFQSYAEPSKGALVYESDMLKLLEDWADWHMGQTL